MASVKNDGTIETKKAGNVKITATSKSNDKVSTFVDVNVLEGERPTKVEWTTTLPSAIIVNDEIQLSAKVLPAKAKQSVTFESSDPSIASVSETGLVKVLKDGSVSLFAKVSDPLVDLKSEALVLNVNGKTAWSDFEAAVQEKLGFVINEDVPSVTGYQKFTLDVSQSDAVSAILHFASPVGNPELDTYFAALKAKKLAIMESRTSEGALIAYYGENNTLGYRVRLDQFVGNTMRVSIVRFTYTTWEQGLTYAASRSGVNIDDLVKPDLSNIWTISMIGDANLKFAWFRLYGDIDGFKAAYVQLMEANGFKLFYDPRSDDYVYATGLDAAYAVKVYEFPNAREQAYAVIEVDAMSEITEVSQWEGAVHKTEELLGIDLSLLPKFESAGATGVSIEYLVQFYKVTIRVLGATKEEVDTYKTLFVALGYAERLNDNIVNETYDPTGSYFVSNVFSQGGGFGEPDQARIQIFGVPAYKEETSWEDAITTTAAYLDTDLSLLKQASIGGAYDKFYSGHENNPRMKNGVFHARGNGTNADYDAWLVKLADLGFEKAYADTLREAWFAPNDAFALVVIKESWSTFVKVRVYTNLTRLDYNKVDLDESPIEKVNLAIWKEKLAIRTQHLIPEMSLENPIKYYFAISPSATYIRFTISFYGATKAEVTAYNNYLKANFPIDIFGEFGLEGVALYEGMSYDTALINGVEVGVGSLEVDYPLVK